MVKFLHRLSDLNPRSATAHFPTFEFLLIPSWDLYIPFLLFGQGSTLKMATGKCLFGLCRRIVLFQTERWVCFLF
jgi:hypothetical protein